MNGVGSMYLRKIMKMSMPSRVVKSILLVISLLHLSAACLDAGDSLPTAVKGTPDYNLSLMWELDATLHTFAQKHGIKEEDEAKFIGRLLMEQPAFPKLGKGGVGIIDSDEYVSPESKRNELEIKGRNWFGKSWNENQIVVIDDQRVLSSISGKDLSNEDFSTLKIVIFTPKEIRFIDLSRGMGGFYERRPTYDSPEGLWSRNAVIATIAGCLFLTFVLSVLWKYYHRRH
jgi:hypothetical protein